MRAASATCCPVPSFCVPQRLFRFFGAKIFLFFKKFVRFIFFALKQKAAVTKAMTELFLQQCIYDSLRMHLHSNAIFLGERLYAESKTLANLHLLATCHFNSGHYKRVYNLLFYTAKEWRPTIMMMSNTTIDHDTSDLIHYLFAVCCCKLQKFKEAEQCLEHLLLQPQFHNDANVNYWFGIIYRYANINNVFFRFFLTQTR